MNKNKSDANAGFTRDLSLACSERHKDRLCSFRIFAGNDETSLKTKKWMHCTIVALATVVEMHHYNY